MDQLLSKLRRSDFWLPNVAIPLAVLALYCLLFGYYHSAIRQLPYGVNLAFTKALWPFLLAGALVAGIAYLLNRTKQAASPLPHDSRWQPLDWLLVLLPLTPIVQYLLNNREILSWSDVVYLLLLFSGVSVLLIWLIPNLLSRFASPSVVRILGLVFAFMLINMASFSATFQWFAQGDLATQLAIALVATLLVGVLYNSKHRALLYILLVSYFLSNTLSQANLNPSPTEGYSLEEYPLFAKLSSLEPPSKPNIYLLIYDSYVTNETMLQYGIDNRAQEKYLIEQGFTLYPHTYSIGPSSTLSMSSLLNVSTRLHGDERNGASGSGAVQGVLKNYGYTTYGIFPSDFFFRGVGAHYDIYFPESKPASTVLLDAILVGEFRFDIGFDKLTEAEYIQNKLSLFETVPNEPFFVYSHSYSPGHSQNSGTCLPDEKEQYTRRLQHANQEMTLDLETILENDPNAIVIVAGDHGPYLSKNCHSIENGGWNLSEVTRFDIQDRYGTFLAIRWPEEGFEQYDDITVLQDVFPAVFAYLLQDPSILDVRVDPNTYFALEIIVWASVEDGIIRGGANDGEPLFIGE